jgi:excisionase family DNA binding protein
MYKLLNASQVAELLGVSESKAYAMMASGEIPTARFGRNVRVRPQDLENFIDGKVVSL